MPLIRKQWRFVEWLSSLITTLFAEGCGLHVSQKADKSLTYSDSWREAGLPGIKIITKITAQSFSCVGAARKVFPDRSQKTMTSHFFKIVSVLFGVRVRHHWWLLFRADATWPQSLVCKPETPSRDVYFFFWKLQLRSSAFLNRNIWTRFKHGFKKLYFLFLAGNVRACQKLPQGKWRRY